MVKIVFVVNFKVIRLPASVFIYLLLSSKRVKCLLNLSYVLEIGCRPVLCVVIWSSYVAGPISV